MLLGQFGALSRANGDELGWMEQVRTNPNGPNPFVLSQDQFAKFADIMKDCAESRLVALDYKGTN